MRLMKDLEWPSVAMLAAAYGLWFVSGLLLWPHHPLLAFAVMAVAVALHASLQHEALHGHPTRNAALNELLVALPLGVFYPYRRFRQMHLAHHNDERLTDPYDDPESWYRSAKDWQRLGAPLRLLLRVNNTLAGRIVLGPLLMIAGFFASEPGRLLHGERGVRAAWRNHLAGLAVLSAIVLGPMGIPPLAYLAIAYAGMALISIRTFCEHRWEANPDGRTVIVERGGVFGLLFLNNNLHIVHHKRPRAPWYELPSLYDADRAGWRRVNGGYVFSSYWDIARAFAFRSRGPVVHPAWRTVQTASSGSPFQASVISATPHLGSPAAIPARQQSK